MRWLLLFVPLVVVLAVAFAFGGDATRTVAQHATPAAPAADNPSAGDRVHIDMAIHFSWDPAAIAHHWCKPVDGGFAECLIYANDDPDAPLVAVEEVVDEATYNGFDPAEQRLWHSNVAEAAAGADPNRPAPSLEEAAAEAEAAGGATYGKLILLGNPETAGELPFGPPQVIYPVGTGPGSTAP